MSAETKGKRWTADHVRLAGAAMGVRAELRRLAVIVGGDVGARLGRLAHALTAALKARNCTRQRCDGADRLPWEGA